MSRTFVSRLYDQRKNCQTSHHGMNKLRVIVATSRNASLVRLSPSEAALIQHNLRDPNLDCLACCKIPYSTTIRIQMTKRIRYNRYTLKDRCQQTFCKILYVHVRENALQKSMCLLRGNPCMYRFMLLPRVRMV